ncbi:ABC transporter substrate-binding protein [Loktanella sp. R86503]|uniref:ABC transporter substrate-binding protein n=1 Tax=Loktanella sp. R86503 TaxID=3093847 RepID=UPI0036DD97BB
MIKWCIAGCLIGWAGVAAAQVDVAVTYLRLDDRKPPTLSDFDPDPADLGIAGAQVGLADIATTGQFLNHTYELTEVVATTQADLLAASAGASGLVVVQAPAAMVLAVADAMPGALVFNAAAADDSLRGADCRANLLHTAPSYAMRADALAQFLVTKRWTDVALVHGPAPADLGFANALRGSAEKFGLRLRGDAPWGFTGDIRRTTGDEVPSFTQKLGDFDMLLVADEIHDFGRYLNYNTWEPRPVGGSEGLTPVAWSPAVEQWGAQQLQSRFRDAAGRGMRPGDYSAWAALRAIGEAVTRTGSSDPAVLRSYLLGPEFTLAGFKGRALSFRAWNGQLRQPIPLVDARAVVAVAPLEGFLHPDTELDTLGGDRPESTCTAFGE